MKCRFNCGACCIIPSISSFIPGMPKGKPAGIPCIHLNSDWRCDIYNSPSRPMVCKGFKADKTFCGNSREEAISILAALEGLTLDDLAPGI